MFSLANVVGKEFVTAMEAAAARSAMTLFFGRKNNALAEESSIGL
jgi:hypothetical protein